MNEDKYVAPELEYYVLIRDDDTTIRSIVKGLDPLYGYGSWDLFAGPFPTWDDASNLGLPWLDACHARKG